MENNQHSTGERNTSTNEDVSFRNEQPGQQIPAGGGSEKADTKPLTQNEQHSESSLPKKDNETLGTP